MLKQHIGILIKNPKFYPFSSVSGEDACKKMSELNNTTNYKKAEKQALKMENNRKVKFNRIKV
jgi:hypothetical protein